MAVIDIDRDAAHAAAQRELGKPIYPRRSPSQQVIDFVEDLLHQLATRAASVSGGWFTISLLLIGVAVAAVAAIRIARRSVRTNRADHLLFGPAELTAAQHRAAAKHCVTSSDWAGAIQHRLRAVARELEEGGVLNAQPGRTANELARDAGAALPQLADDLIRAAEIFNDVSYGELPAKADGYHRIAALDDRLAAAHPLLPR